MINLIFICSDDAVGRGGVVEGKVEEDEARIIGNGRRGFTGLNCADDFRGHVSGEVGECCYSFVDGGVGDGGEMECFGGIRGEVD